MDRKVLDKVLMWLGAALALVFLAGSVLAWWGFNFANDQIKSQLVQEKIYFPKAGTPALDPKEFPGLQQYAGTQVDNGDKARAYADEYIWVHMMKSSDGKTYAEVSEAARANPKDQKLSALKATLFQGDMLRSSLLTAYAFSRFGVIAYWAMAACLAGAGIMVLVFLFSFWHLRRAAGRQ